MDVLKGAYTKNDPVYLQNWQQYEEPKEYFKLVVDLVEAVYGRHSISLVDVGCASGAFLYYAKKRLDIADCVGVDISDLHLDQAKAHLPEGEFVLDSITRPQRILDREFDVCTCLGTMAVFDDIDEVLSNLLALIKQRGVLYIFDLFNPLPIDVLMRYRVVQGTEDQDWKAGFNVRSELTYERSLRRIDQSLKLRWINFDMPFPIEQTSDPMRAWTMQTKHKDHQLVVGTGQLLNFRILQVNRSQ